MATTPFVVLQAYNPDLLLNVQSTFVTTDETSLDTTLAVENIVGFSDGDYVLIEDFGQENAEIARISGAPSAGVLTLATALSFIHTKDTRVYRIDRDRVEFSRATTLTGSKSVLATVDITPDSLYTVYEDVTNTTGFGFYRWNNQADNTFSNYSESTPYAGYSGQTLKRIFDTALSDLGYLDSMGQPKFPTAFSRETAVQAVMDCQEELGGLKTRWSYLTDFDVIVSELSTGQDEYALPSTIARENGRLALWNVRIGRRNELKYMDKNEFNERREEVVKTSLGAAISSVADTEVTLSDVSDIDDSGSFVVIDDDGEGFDTITYTGKTNSTNLATGVAAITETHANGAIVWQGVSFSEPARYTVYEDTLFLDPPPAVAWNDFNLIADLYIRPTVVNDLADEAQFPAYVIKPYVSWKLALASADGDPRKADYFKQIYDDKVKDLLRNERNGQKFLFKPSRRPERTQLHPPAIGDSSRTDTNT